MPQQPPSASPPATGLPRRPIIFGSLAASAVVAPLTASGKDSATDAGLLQAGLFTRLSSVTVPDAVGVLQTTGHHLPGIGAARYVATQRGGQTPYRTQTANGRWFELAETIVFVEMLGAVGGDERHDDGPAIQAAIDYNEERLGGVVWCAPGATYHLRAAVLINSTRTSIEGNGATWSFDIAPDPAAASPSKPEPCVLVRVPASPAGTQYGHDTHFCRALRVSASAASSGVLDGFVLDTEVNLFSSRWTFYDVEAASHLRRGLVLATRAYLVKSYASHFDGIEAGVEYVGGPDSGENFSFFGGVFGSGGGAALKNNGGEFYLFGVSADFPKSFIRQTGGTTHCFGCHFETGLRAGAIGTPFDITGELYIDGGAIMGGAPLDGSQILFDHFFVARDVRSRIVLRNVWGYNWQSSEHVVCGGAGRFSIEGLLGGSNWNIPGIVKRDAAHSLLGDAGLFVADIVKLDAWLATASGARRVDRLTLVWSDHGRDYGRAAAAVSTASAHSGTRSLAISKGGVGRGTDLALNVLVPFPPGGRMCAGELWLRSDAPIAGPAPMLVYSQLHWASLLGRDADSVPLIGQASYVSEANVNLAASAERQAWTRLSYHDPLNIDRNDPLQGRAPAWATHLLLTINLVNLVPGNLFVDDVYLFAI